jgi:hypothetical protein
VGKKNLSLMMKLAGSVEQECSAGMPKMLGLSGQEVHQSNLGWSPVYVEDNLGVMSIGFLLSQPDDAIIWRGPRKNSIIKSFLKDTYWGEESMDVLIVDAPPGTSDEHISIIQLLKNCNPGACVCLGRAWMPSLWTPRLALQTNRSAFEKLQPWCVL